ncbi:MAG: RNA recognition motif domain-containing protein [Saprospiraceae bacterium]
MNIFVAKLSYDTDSDLLRSTFEKFGEVTSAKVIFDRETGNSRGFGFVEMANDDEGREAIQELDGVELDGRTIVVKQSEDRDNRGGGGGFNRNNNRGGGGGNFRGRDNNNRGGGNNYRGGNNYNSRDSRNDRNDRWS